MTVDAAYKQVLFIMRKNQAGGLSADDFQRVFNAEQSAYLSDLLGRWQNRGNGKTGQNTGLVENETILTKLAPFTKNAGLTILAGDAILPDDFVYQLDVRIDDEKVTYLPKSQLSAMLKSVIDPPDETTGTYYYTNYQTFLRFFPSTVTISDLDYVARPAEVVWGYTFDADDRQQYDPGLSIDPEWLDEDTLEICRRCLKTLGVSFKDVDMQGFGNSVIQTGD